MGRKQRRLGDAPAPAWLRGGGRGTGAGPGPGGPRPQEVYDVDSGFPDFRDVHRDGLRPSVVIRLIPHTLQLTVMTRTTDLTVEGVEHEPRPDWGLHERGKFAKDWIQTLDTRLFVSPLVDLLGVLDDDTWWRVLAMWEAS